jgi:Zn-dependent protease
MSDSSLLDQLAPQSPQSPPARKRGLVVGIVATLTIVAAKAKTLGLLALKFGTTAATMLVAAWAYSSGVGWPFAALFVGLILVHEIGHGLAARRFGIPVGAPVFIPFFGAFITIKGRQRDRWEAFVIAAGGPLLGGVASLACMAASVWVTGDAHRLLRGAGFFALVLNLFNLLPVWILDGSKMLPLVRTEHAFVGLAGVVVALVGSALLAGHVNGIAILVALVVAWQVAMATREHRRVPETMLERVAVAPVATASPSEQISPTRRRIGAWVYFGMIAVYTAVSQLTALTRH